MVETMAEAFEFTYKRVERRRELREVGEITTCLPLINTEVCTDDNVGK